MEGERGRMSVVERRKKLKKVGEIKRIREGPRDIERDREKQRKSQTQRRREKISRTYCVDIGMLLP